MERTQIDKANDGSIATAEWTPAVDIKENTEQFLIQVDIPGVKKEDIEISMEAGVLTVKGEKTSGTKTENESFKRVERMFGSFYRRCSLPDSANSDAIDAQVKTAQQAFRWET